jgi:3-methyladenine DNA glycosylase AlkD
MTEFAYRKAVEWSDRDREFVRRAGFALMATLAVHDKGAGDKEFFGFLSIIESHSVDERNFVKKAVNWSLRQIGKRNPRLNKAAIHTAKRIQKIDSKAAKWVAADALRELTSYSVQMRFRKS